MASQLLADQPIGVRFAIRCWGAFALTDTASGIDLKLRGRKARAVLAYLAMHPSKPVSRERLMALLWGERADEQARASLRQTLFELRSHSHGEHPLLEIDREAVSLQAEAVETDIDRWRRLTRECHYERLVEELPDSDDALFANLDGIDGGFDEWLQVERTRQREALTTLIGDASAGAIAAGRTRAARVLHARLVEFNPEGALPAPPASMAATSPLSPETARRPVAAIAASLLVAATFGSLLYGIERPGTPVAAPTPSREIRDLYENARTIVYQRKGSEFPVAEKLLRRVLMLDPNYVPAISALAAVTEMNSPTPEQHDEAERLARRAVQLAPNSGKANGVLGMVLRFESPEARAAIKKAAALDGNDPEIQFWLSQILGLEGDDVGRLQALRRAAAIDPSWQRASGLAALAAWEMGYPEEAARYAARLREISLGDSFLCDYALDWAKGDYSEVVRDTLAAREKLADTRVADVKLGFALLALGREQPARLLLHLPPPLWRVAIDSGPAPGELEPLLIASESDAAADAFELTALRQVLRDGRASEIVAAYDRRVARFGRLASGTAPHDELINDGLQVALALRAMGREPEAARLLAQADAAIRKSFSYGGVPNWLYASAAGVWAAQGRKDEALVALKTALDRGWHYAPKTPLPDMGTIPSFATLRGDPRFERLRRRELDHLERERRALGPVPA